MRELAVYEREDDSEAPTVPGVFRTQSERVQYGYPTRRAYRALIIHLVRQARACYGRGSGSGNVHPEYRDGQAEAFMASARSVAFYLYNRPLRTPNPGQSFDDFNDRTPVPGSEEWVCFV